jgi:tetratricopeptide (TPR) repeat protein/DNA-binding MarR family transcriptional regulator
LTRIAREPIAVRLTAKERILLHLLDYVKFQEALEVPPAMTQEGLAAAAWVELRHLSQYLRPLLRDGLVRERTCHVDGIRQRRKVYALTEAGQHAAHRLRERVRAETVRIKDLRGVREETYGKVLEAAKSRVSLVELVHRATRDGQIDLESLAAGPAVTLVESLAEAPRLERFVGRTEELNELTAEKPGPRIFVIRGVAGIGKSSLAARACELLRGKQNLFWHTLRTWDTPVSVLSALGDFLSSLGKPGLRAVVSRGELRDAADVLKEDLPGTHSVLVFDDGHEASDEILPLLRLLKDAMADAPDVRVLVLTRRALAFYDRRDVALRGIVREMDLSGLKPADIAEFLSPDMDVATAHLGKQLGGHPLFLQLVRSSVTTKAPHAALRDMRRFIEEEVYVGLSEPERRVLNLASLYRIPVPRGALLADPRDSYELILTLVNRSLLRSVGDEGFEAHDSIRTVFAELLAPAERDRLAGHALQQLRALATKARESGALVPCVGYVSNALLLASDPAVRSGLYESLGDAEEELGDLPAALTAYKEAMKGREGAEERARLHRKSAQALRQRGQVDAAMTEIDNGLRLLGDMVCEERAWLDVVQSAVAGWKEQWEDAFQRGNDALRTFRAFGSRLGEGWALYQLGFLEIEAPHGDPARAEGHLGEALSLGIALADVNLMARAHTGLAYLFAYRLGRVEESLEHLSAIEALPSTVRDPHARRSLLMLKGWIYLELLGDCESAEKNFQDVIAFGRKIHDSTAIVSAHTGLARCTYCRGFVEDARRAFEGCVTELMGSALSVAVLEDVWLAAECSLRLGDLASFRRMASLLEDPRLAESVQARPLHAGVLRGVDLLLRGDREGWHTAFRQAFQVARGGSASADPAHLALAHLLCGVTSRAAGEDGEAVEHLRVAREILSEYHLEGRKRIVDDAERELTEELTRALKP